MLRERRHHNSDVTLSLEIVRLVGATVLVLSIGSVLLEWHGIKTPEWVGNAVIGGTGGLIGFLSRGLLQSGPTVATGPVEDITVGAPADTTEEK